GNISLSTIAPDEIEINTNGATVNIGATEGNVIINGLQYPNSDGTVSQLLSTDGAGVLSFSDVIVTSVFGRTGDIISVSGDYNATQITYDNTNSVLTSTNTQTAIDEVQINVEDRVSWKNNWIVQEYQKNDMVFDDGWTMIANKKTTDKAAPAQSQDPTWALPDSPSWSSESSTSNSYSGVSFEISDITDIVDIDAMRIWLPETGVNLKYEVWIFDITDAPDDDPLLGTLLFSQNLDSVQSTGWITINFQPYIVGQGTQIMMVLHSRRAIGQADITAVWEHDGSGTLLDTDQGKYKQNQFTEFQIHEQEQNGGIQSWLNGLKEGDEIREQEIGNSSRWNEYSVISNTKVGQVYTFAVQRVSNGSSVRSGKDVNITGRLIDSITNSPYVELLDYWTDNTPSEDVTVFGFAVESVSDINTGNFNKNAYGVDLFSVLLNVSDDWDLVATTSKITGGSSDGNGIISADLVSYNNTKSDLSALNVQDAIDELETATDDYITITTTTTSESGKFYTLNGGSNSFEFHLNIPTIGDRNRFVLDDVANDITLIADGNIPIDGSLDPIVFTGTSSNNRLYEVVYINTKNEWNLWELGAFNRTTVETVIVSTNGDDSTTFPNIFAPFKTIKAAVEYSKDIATKSNPIKIDILPGIFEEDNPIIIDNGFVNLFGSGASTTIVLPNNLDLPVLE
ncbi:MAG: hypothetical protein ACC656_03870, partial [Candidatus Heimdallarchaeota archaeon]